MKQTVEEAAKTFSNHLTVSNVVKNLTELAFKAGAGWQANQSPWISVEKRLPEKDGYYLVTDGENVGAVYFFKEWNKFAVYEKYPYPFYKDGVIKLYMPIPSFDQILEANKDVLQRMKEKGTL